MRSSQLSSKLGACQILLIFLVILYYIETPINSVLPFLNKYISLPLLVLDIFLVKQLYFKSSTILSWSGIFIVLMSFVPLYIASYPIVLFTNAAFSSGEKTRLIGVVERKFLISGGKAHIKHFAISIQNNRTSTTVELKVTKKEYDNIHIGSTYGKLFYKGALNIPWYLKGHPPK